MITASLPPRPLVAWSVALGLVVVGTSVDWFWTDATTGPLCRAGPHAPTLWGTAGLVGLTAALAGLAGLALGQDKRIIAAQAAAVAVLTTVCVGLVAFAYVGAHHCFD